MSAVAGGAVDALSIALIVLGLLVTAVTIIGVVRLRGLYLRLQAASKASMLGTVAILAAAIGTGDGPTVGRAVLVALFVMLTTPVAAHAIAEAAARREERDRHAAADRERPAPPGSRPATDR